MLATPLWKGPCTPMTNGKHNPANVNPNKRLQMNDFINVGDKVYYDAGGGQETWRVMWKDADEEEVQLQNSQGATTFAHVNSVNKIEEEMLGGT